MRTFTIFSLFVATAFAQEASTDGTCGRFFGTTCDGNPAGTGMCCGANNLCGSDSTACGTGCQADYGTCNDMSTMSMSSAAAGGNAGLGAAGIAPSSSSMMASSAMAGMAGMPIAASSSTPYAMGAYSKPASVIFASSSMPASMMANAGMAMPASPSPSMAMDGIAVAAPSSAVMSSSMPSMAWSGQGKYSKVAGSMSWMPEYNATVTVTKCSGKASPTPMAAWNGTMPNTTMAMPTGHVCNGGCHKPEFSNGADVLRLSGLMLVLLGVSGVICLLA